MSLRSEFRVVTSFTISALKTMFGSYLPPVIYIICVCLCVVVSNTYCVVFFFFFGLGLVCSVLPVSLIVYFWSPFRRSLNVYLIIKTSTSPRPVQSDCVCFISKGFVGVFKLIIQFVHATI